MRILWVDFETGGLDCNVHSPLQIGLLATDGDKTIGEREWLIRDENMVVSQKALQTNHQNLTLPGILSKQFKSEYYAFVSLFFDGHTVDNSRGYDFINMVGWSKEKQAVFGGHNVPFDRPWFKKILDGKRDYLDYHSVDTMALAITMKDMGLLPKDQSVSLTNLCAYFGIPVDDSKAHSALYDCHQAFTLYKKMKEKLRGI